MCDCPPTRDVVAVLSTRLARVSSRPVPALDPSASPGFEPCVAYQRTLVAALRQRHALGRAAGAQRGEDARLAHAVQPDHYRALGALRGPRQLEELELACRRRYALLRHGLGLLRRQAPVEAGCPAR